MLLHEDFEVLVEQGLFSGWRITDRRTGARVTPDRDLSIAMGLAWHAVRRARWSSHEDRALAEAALFARFARCALHPTGDDAVRFRAETPADHLAIAARAVATVARERATEAQPWRRPDTRSG